MSNYNKQLPNFIVYCVLFIGGLYELILSGNFSSYSTTGLIKSIIALALVGLLIVMYFYRNKDNEEDK